ncbi:hypothetical protein PMIN06_008053 [Paraphaeosphaeria minitans]
MRCAIFHLCRGRAAGRWLRPGPHGAWRACELGEAVVTAVFIASLRLRIPTYALFSPPKPAHPRRAYTESHVPLQIPPAAAAPPAAATAVLPPGLLALAPSSQLPAPSSQLPARTASLPLPLHTPHTVAAGGCWYFDSFSDPSTCPWLIGLPHAASSTSPAFPSALPTFHPEPFAA